MAESKTSSLFKTIKDDPATHELMKNLGGYAKARVTSGVQGALKPKEKPGDEGISDKDKDDSPDTAAKGAASEVMGAVSEGDSPLKMIGKGVKGAVKGAVKKKGGSANKRPTNITDEFWIGLPVTDVYNQWSEYKAFPSYMKGPTNVSVDDDYIESSWKAKIFLNNRSWKAKTVEQIPDQRIKWTTESNKGSVDGCVTFHEVADRLTLMIFVLEYRPKGFFEWWGNRWRTVGRRYRLDVKHFRRYLMMNGETVPDDAGFRGTIEGGEVKESDEDARNREQDEKDQKDEQDAKDQEEGDETDEATPEEGDTTAPEEGNTGDVVSDGEADPDTDPDEGEGGDPEPVVDKDDKPADAEAPEVDEKPSRSDQREARRAKRRG